MTLLDRYILKEWLKVFGMALGTMVGLLIIGQIFDSMSDFLEWKTPGGKVALYYVYQLPSQMPIVLPVELVSFMAEQDDATMLLLWRTATEQHTDHFIVERSNGDNTWTELGVLPSAGHSTSSILYRFVDRTPPEGHVYYRLRMVDLDGSYALSPTVHGFFRSPVPVVYPNPASGRFHVRAGDGALLVLDALGRPMRHQVTGRQGDAVQVWLPEAAPGCYTVHVGGPTGRVEHLVLR